MKKTEVKLFLDRIDKREQIGIQEFYRFYNQLMNKNLSPSNCTPCHIACVKDIRNTYNQMVDDIIPEEIIIPTEEKIIKPKKVVNKIIKKTKKK